MTMLASNVQKSAILQQTVMRLQQHIRLEGRISGVFCFLTYTDKTVMQNSSTRANLALLVAKYGGQPAQILHLCVFCLLC